MRNRKAPAGEIQPGLFVFTTVGRGSAPGRPVVEIDLHSDGAERLDVMGLFGLDDGMAACVQLH